MNQKNRRLFKRAEELSQLSDHHRFKIGATLSKGRKVLGVGYNTLSKTHPLQASYALGVGKPEAIYLHAEMAAIVEAKSKGHDLTDSVLHVFRRGLGGDLRMARPCKICMNAIRDHKIKELHYTTDMGYAHEVVLYS